VSHEGTSRDGARFRAYAEFIAAIVTVVAVAVPVGIYLANHLGSKTVTTNPSGVTETAAPVQPNGPAVARVVQLEALQPDTGSTNLGSLPRALASDPGYAHAVVIPCGSNNVGDQKRDVAYLLGSRFVSMTATVHAYKATSDESHVQVTIFADDRQPDAATMEVNAAQDITVDLDGVKRMTVRVVCDLPGATAILSGATLTHA
jgi:hypothetical protein